RPLHLGTPEQQGEGPGDDEHANAEERERAADDEADEGDDEPEQPDREAGEHEQAVAEDPPGSHAGQVPQGAPDQVGVVNRTLHLVVLDVEGELQQRLVVAVRVGGGAFWQAHACLPYPKWVEGSRHHHMPAQMRKATCMTASAITT